MADRPNRALLCISHFDQAHYWAAGGMEVARVGFGARYYKDALSQHNLQHSEASPEPHLCPPVVRNEGSRHILVSRAKLPLGALGAELLWQMLDDLCVGHVCPYRL